MNIISYNTEYSLSVLGRLHWHGFYTTRKRFVNSANFNYVAKEVLLIQESGFE